MVSINLANTQNNTIMMHLVVVHLNDDSFCKGLFTQSECVCKFFIATNGLYRIDSKCSHGAIATANFLSQQMGCIGLTVSVHTVLLQQQN